MSNTATLVARRLRRDATTAERVLWAALRNRQIVGSKVRRQAPLGAFIVDFLLPEVRLVIEVDGGQHDGSAADAQRDALLREKGWCVVRYWNHEVLRNTEGVLADIARVILDRRAAHPLTPTLSPEGERGCPAQSAIAPNAIGRRPRRPAPSPHRGEGRGEGASPRTPLDHRP